MTLVLTPRMATGLPPAGTVPPPFSIDSGGARIGRGMQADLVLPDPTTTVSSQHCSVTWSGQAWVLNDTSTNGTLVNGTRIAGSQPLRDGDVVRIGPYELAVSITDGGARPMSAPALSMARPADDWNRATPSGTTQHAPVTQAAANQATDPVSQLLSAAGLSRGAVSAPDAAVLAAAGGLLRQAIDGTVSMVAARAKARQELGIPADPPSNNPVKRGAPADQALAQLLTAPGHATKALADAQAELDAHQRATLAAMQGALRAALDNFAPAAIKARTGDSPAAAWKAYEKAFDAPDGFIETFASELGKAYTALAAAKKG